MIKVSKDTFPKEQRYKPKNQLLFKAIVDIVRRNIENSKTKAIVNYILRLVLKSKSKILSIKNKKMYTLTFVVV